MRKIGNFLKSLAKWGGILLLIYVGSQMLSGLDFESRMGWFLAGLAIAIAYVDGSHKDRISDLENRVDRLARQISGQWPS